MATVLNLTIEQGATFTQAVAVGAAYDGYTARAALRSGFGGALLATYTATTVASGSTTLGLAAAITAALTPPTWADASREITLGVYELELVSPDGLIVVRARQGSATLSRKANV